MNTITTDAWATKEAVDMAAALPYFHVSVFGGIMPSTAAALSAALGTPLITFKNVVQGANNYAITWATPVALSRTLIRNQSEVVVGVGTAAAGTGTTGTWAVIHSSSDTLGADTGKLRKAMTFGTSGTAIETSNPIIIQGVSRTLDANLQCQYLDAA